MANEFKIKNGFFSEGSSNITGSLSVSAGITGSLQGTASYATQAISANNATIAESTAAVAGTANYIPKFTSGTTIGDSLIYDNEGNIGIGTLTAGVKLDTVGYVRDTKRITAEQEPFTLSTNWSGDVIEGAIHGSVSTWDLVNLDTDGVWYQADNNTLPSTYLLGIYTGVDNLVLLEGHITVNEGVGGSPDIQGLLMGIPIYIRDGALGRMSTIIPTTTGNYVRICGHAYYKSGGTADTYIMKFRPSNDWVQL